MQIMYGHVGRSQKIDGIDKLVVVDRQLRHAARSWKNRNMLDEIEH
jgi:hypothetical protein